MVRRTALTLAWALVSVAYPAWAVDRTAASCSGPHVQAAIDASANGDRVIIPPGSCTWTTSVSTGQKAIKIIGNNANPTLPAQGADGAVTITVDNGAVNAFFTVYETTVSNTEVSNLTFVQGPGRPVTSMVLLQHVVNGLPILFHHNNLVYHQCAPGIAISTSFNRGVVWRNQFLNDVPLAPCGWLTATTAINVEPSVTDGLALWNSMSTLGAVDTNGDKHLYFEMNRIENFTNNAFDINDGGRFVARHNTFLDTAGANHGHDSGVVGARQMEIYDNTFVLTDRGNDTANLGRWIGLRGGTGVITDNIFPVLNVPAFGGLKSNVTLAVFVLQSAELGGCYTGTYPWLRQIGRGWDGSLDPHGDPQVLDPLYYWNNRVSPGGPLATGMVSTNLPVNTCGLNAPDVSVFLQQGRDFYNEVARPGYVKYQYPHPLTLSSSPASRPIAPTNLQVR